MRLFLLICLIGTTYAGFFGLFGGSKKEEVHLTRPDEGELSGTSNPNLGRSIELDGTARERQGGEIVIPKNGGGGGGGGGGENIAKTTRPNHQIPRTTTRPPVERELPSDDRPTSNRGGCPRSVDAYSPGPSSSSYLFEGSTVYILQGKRVSSVVPISRIFPSGPRSVKAAVYDKDKELIVLFEGRQVYGYKTTSSPDVFQLDSSYPKDLPDSIAFSPNAAIRWHDEHQMLLSSGGMFALYDEYWNKSLMSGRTASYFEGLPDGVRGISVWSGPSATVFGQSLVFQYDKERKAVQELIPIQQYLQC